MVGVMITGHGHFASGLLSAVHLVAGQQEGVKAVDFAAGMSTAQLEELLLENIKQMGCDEILVLTDLAGGSPFNTISTLRGKLEGKQIKILSGTNMSMALEAVFSHESMDLNALVQDVTDIGVDGIKDLDVILAENELECDDGL